MRRLPFVLSPGLHLGALAALSAAAMADDRPPLNPWRGHRQPKKRPNQKRYAQVAAKRARKITRRNRR